MTALEDLEKRIEKLENQHHRSKVTDDSIRRARSAVEAAGLFSACWKFVPEKYYSWGLEERRRTLNARSTLQLCKSLLMENKKCTAPNATNPRFVLVIVQYAASLDTKKLIMAIRALRPVKERLDDNEFDFRIASTEDNDRLTGYQHNSVSPFGLLEKVPVVLASAIKEEGFFWMGGGHVHLKLGMSVGDAVQGLKPIVADITQPRTGGLDDNLED